MKSPFTIQEKEIMDLLIDAHNKFMKIRPVHSSHIDEWINGIHKCQNVIIGRIVIREYPHIFNHLREERNGKSRHKQNNS